MAALQAEQRRAPQQYRGGGHILFKNEHRTLDQDLAVRRLPLVALLPAFRERELCAVGALIPRIVSFAAGVAAGVANTIIEAAPKASVPSVA
jgi:hypothetical protein